MPINLPVERSIIKAVSRSLLSLKSTLAEARSHFDVQFYPHLLLLSDRAVQDGHVKDLPHSVLALM